MTKPSQTLTPTATHWGNHQIKTVNGQLASVHAYQDDLDPTPLGQALLDSQDPRVRISQPMVRAGFLEHGPRAGHNRRGQEPFVAVSWEQALDLVANELERVVAAYGNEAIYGGSYGWSSAGTLHVARWNMHRVLNEIGGFTESIGSYSTAAYEAIAPHILASNGQLVFDSPSWEDVAAHAELVVFFGGAALKNSQVSFGGLGPHLSRDGMAAATGRNIQFVNISPIREDIDLDFPAEWLAPRPNTDAAIMLGLAHTLITEGMVNLDYVHTYTVGYDQFVPYVLGEADGVPKDSAWAEAIAGLPAGTLAPLARRMARCKTLIGVNWAIQRAQHGEQPYWLAIILAAMLGEIGKPGRGIALGMNAMHALGSNRRPLTQWPARPVGENKTNSAIPVARIADMLLNPGQPYSFNGADYLYPDIKLIYWVGGNPFHHHQDIHRLIRAWQQPETIIVNDPFWTATARHADIVLPAATMLERNDLNFTLLDATITPMRQAVAPFAQARTDYDIFLGVARRLGFAEAYSEGRDEMGWVRHFYEEGRQLAAEQGYQLPDFESFWLGDPITLTALERHIPLVEKFYTDPDANPLPTPSGKIEIFSETIASFGYDDCLGHPAWLPPDEWLGAPLAERYPLHLLSNQPKTRLHSQYDHARTSQDGKEKGREPAYMHPADAAARDIADGDVVRIFNDRGACLAVMRLSEDHRQGVLQLPTGAWYNPVNPQEAGSLEIHGNPNVLTRDVGTSRLAQGPSPNSTLVDVERYDGPLHPITIHDLPEIIYPED